MISLFILPCSKPDDIPIMPRALYQCSQHALLSLARSGVTRDPSRSLYDKERDGDHTDTPRTPQQHILIINVEWGQQIVFVLTVVNQNAVAVFRVIHILSAVYFALGAILAIIFTLQVPNTPTLSAKARVMGQSSMVARFMIVPGALLAGITGFVVTSIGGRSYTQGWLLVSIALFVLALAIGASSGPTTAKLRRQVETEARSGKRPSAALVQSLNSRAPLALAVVNVAITLLLIVLMFVQPGS